MEGKQALDGAISQGWIDLDDAAALEARFAPLDARGVPYRVMFESNNGELTKVTIRVYNPKNARRGGGAVK